MEVPVPRVVACPLSHNFIGKSFDGQMGEIYLLKEVTSEGAIQEIARLTMSRLADQLSPDVDATTPAGRLSLRASYHPQRHISGVVLDVHSGSHGTLGSGRPSVDHARVWTIRTGAAAIHSLGGVQLLIPLFLQLLRPDRSFRTYYTSSSSSGNTSSNGTSPPLSPLMKDGVGPVATRLNALAAFLDGHLISQHHFHRIAGPQILTWVFSRLSPADLSVDMEPPEGLVQAICKVCLACEGYRPLADEMVRHLFFNLQLWGYSTSHTLHEALISAQFTFTHAQPGRFREVVGVGRYLSMIADLYSPSNSTPQSAAHSPHIPPADNSGNDRAGWRIFDYLDDDIQTIPLKRRNGEGGMRAETLRALRQKAFSVLFVALHRYISGRPYLYRLNPFIHFNLHISSAFHI